MVYYKMTNIYKIEKRTKHYSPYSGGGSEPGHEGAGSVAGVKGVYVEIIPRPEDYFEPLFTRKYKSSVDPYKRRCDFGNQYKAVN